MPKLRDETYAARRQHILDAARTCFARDGFHGASMTDLQEEAGVSAGAIYIYFPSKDDIIEAIAEENVATLCAVFDGVALHEPPLSLRDALRTAVRLMDQRAVGNARGLAFDLWGETLRSDRVAAVVRRGTRDMRRSLLMVVERAMQTGEIAPQGRPEDVTRFLLGAIYGYYVQRIITGGLRPTPYVDALIDSLDP